METFYNIALGSLTAATVANLAHWNGNRTERLAYHPKWRWLDEKLEEKRIASGWVLVVYLLLFLLFFLLRKVGVIPRVASDTAGILAVLYLDALQVYSIWFRWKERIRKTPSEEPPDTRPVFRWLAGFACAFFLLMAITLGAPQLLGWNEERSLLGAGGCGAMAIIYGLIAVKGKFENRGGQPCA